MTTIQLKYGQAIIIDPCYIKKVGNYYNNEFEHRFDALKLVKVLHEGDDGGYLVSFPVYNGNGEKDTIELGVDSGRLWVLQAEFDCELEVDGSFTLTCENPNLDDIELVD